MDVRYLLLSTPDAWNGLRQLISGVRSDSATEGIIARLVALDAKAVVIEEPYLDQDFTAEFSAFYSKLFRRIGKACRRLHFFRCDVMGEIGGEVSASTIAWEAIAKRGDYLGFAVIRPTPRTSIGRTVLCAPPSPADHKSTLLVRSVFEAHLFGATLPVEGIPFIQQDGRLSACAQASIWMAARHVQSKHRGPWVSTVDIAEAALKPTDHLLSQAIPAGSNGLSVEHIVRALRAIGREPLVYMGSRDQASGKVEWPALLEPLAVVERYIDSGIPVILALSPWEQDQRLGHAVVACGHTTAKRDPASGMPPAPTRSVFCTHLLVNDDQRGPALRMPVDTAAAGLSETPYSLANVWCVIVPLPSKVYIPAEHAELLARDALREYADTWPAIRAGVQSGSSSIAAGDEIVGLVQTDRAIVRTYLTYGWKYRKRILANTCSPTIKQHLLAQDLPRYVWVTEFGTASDLNMLDEADMKVFGHCVVDATSNISIGGVCVFHAPGILVMFADSGSPLSWKSASLAISDDGRYQAKVRGM